MVAASAVPLTGIQPIAGINGFVYEDPFATAEQRNGGVADVRHASVGEDDSSYPWQVFPGEEHGPYGTENDLIGFDICSYTAPADHVYDDPTMDQTPITRAAPWPKGLPTTTDPDDVSARRQESADIHSSNLGGSREALFEPTLCPVQDEWDQVLETDPGITFPEMQSLPSQLLSGGSGGWGSTDRVQSLARQNQYGFDSAHMHRRYATGTIPGNFLWMEPGGRPLVKSVAGTAKVPVGPDSPFYGQDPGVPFNSQGAALADLPVGYTGPPDPALATGYAQADTFNDEIPLW